MLLSIDQELDQNLLKEKGYLCITVGYHLPFRYNELVHLPYIAVASNTRESKGLEGEQLLLITETNTIVGLYPYSMFTNPMFLLLTVSIVNTFSCKYNSISSHIVVCFLLLLHAFTNQNATITYIYCLWFKKKPLWNSRTKGLSVVKN